MSTKEQILFEMPEEFSRSDWMDQFSKTGLSYSYANKSLDSALYSGELERVDRGRYRKTETEPATA